MRYWNSFVVCLILNMSTWGHANDFIKKLPTQIDAENGLQCNKNNSICKAFKATVTHDTMMLKGDVITAYFQEKGGLLKVEVEGHVEGDSKGTYHAQGHHGSLNVDTGIVTLSGEAKVVDLQHSRTLKGEKLIVRLKKSPSTGKIEIERVEGHAKVEIITPKEVVKADKGVYEADQDFIVLTGNVRITNKDGQLKGDNAKMDLKTGMSRITSNKGPVQVFLRGRDIDTKEISVALCS